MQFVAYVYRAFKYRIYPTSAQASLLSKHFGCVRWLYNRSLELKTTAWTERKENITRYQLSAELPALKSSDETCWLKEVNAQSLQQALVNLDTAYVKFFRSGAKFPKFKSKHGVQSFQVPQHASIQGSYIKLPKIGQVRAKIDRDYVGGIKTVTISRTTTGKYFASVLCDDGVELPAKKPVSEAGTIGIDLGLKHFATLSDGRKIDNPRPLRRRLKRLARAQRIQARRTKGGKNRDKQRRVVARCHEKVANTRKDFLHKLTTSLVRDNQTDTFAIEDLAVSNMMKNHRLALSIADAGWGTFRTLLQYKAERAGKNVLVISRFDPSSKACTCGILNKDLKLSDRVWTCECGRVHDRDLNAARNIKRFALHPQNRSVPRDTRESTPEETSP